MSDTLSALVSTSRTRGQPALFVGLAGDAPMTPPTRIGLGGVDRVDIGRGETRSVTRGRDRGSDVVTLTLADGRLSSKHARLNRVGASWVLEDLASKNGTWIGRQQITRKSLADGEAFVVGHTALVFREVGGEAPDLDGLPRAIATGFMTLSPSLAARYDELAIAARSAIPIELRGESGTGKELAARAVHALSGRRGKFVAVNCGALPTTLVEAELFGHRRGAFTGATEDRLGFVRSSDGGTLFLDEVAELPAVSQAALLRVLQENEVTPVGADRAVSVDLRVITATHRNLDADVDAGRFRADLRARMLGTELALPALRDRREDLGLLIATLLDRPVAFFADAVAALYDYAWPLNIRELQRALASASAVAGSHIELRHLPASIASTRPEPQSSTLAAALSEEDRATCERLVGAMAKHDNNIAAVARELGKDRTQIRRWLKRFGITGDASSS